MHLQAAGGKRMSIAAHPFLAEEASEDPEAAGTEAESGAFFPMQEEQAERCAAIVPSVSPSCVKTAAQMFSCSSERHPAMLFAKAVTPKVSSHGFIRKSPPILSLITCC